MSPAKGILGGGGKGGGSGLGIDFQGTLEDRRSRYPLVCVRGDVCMHGTTHSKVLWDVNDRYRGEGD